MEAMTRQEWKREKRRLWWRKNEDKVIGAAMAPIPLAMMWFVIKASRVLDAGKLFEIVLQALVVFVLSVISIATLAAIIKLLIEGGKDE